MSQIAICGQGRIGSKVIETLKDQGHEISTFRLDKEKGLYSKDSETPANINLLLICISSAKAKGQWDWTNIFNGLQQQINSGELTINNLIFVSSTRVFDGIDTGMVTADTKPVVSSERGQKVLHGEKALESVCSNLHIVRCSGLIGGGYDSYKPILAVASDRPRFAVDVEEVKSFIVHQIDAILKQAPAPKFSLLTDGKVHFEGKGYDLTDDADSINNLAERFRILVNSVSN